VDADELKLQLRQWSLEAEATLQMNSANNVHYTCMLINAGSPHCMVCKRNTYASIPAHTAPGQEEICIV